MSTVASVSNLSSASSTTLNRVESSDEITIDFQAPEDVKAREKELKAQKRVDQDMKNGTLKLVPVKFCGIKVGEQYEYNVKKDESGYNQTLGSIKQRYNLPDGVFEYILASGKANTSDLCRGESLDKARSLVSKIYISKSVMDKAIGRD